MTKVVLDGVLEVVIMPVRTILLLGALETKKV
jgi:hypothetical protein